MSFEKEREELIEKVKYSTSTVEAIKILSKVRAEFDCIIPGYRNSLKILSDTTYEDRKHFLLELIQNADDSRFKEEPSIELEIGEDRFIIRYNEEGFQIDDVIAITDTGGSTKAGDKRKANSFIGEKGIGFKSVFALAKQVNIKSGKWNFYLNSNECVIPRLIEGNENYITEGTELTIFFKDNESLNIISNQLNKYFNNQIETFIFLQKLSHFKFIDRRKGNSIENEIVITPSNRKGDSIVIQNINDNQINKYLVYSEEIIFSKELVSGRWDKIGHEIGELKRNVSVVVPIDIKENIEGRVFCFLPTEIKLPLPMYLQIDGQTKADREKLHDPFNNPWNVFLLEKIPQIIINAYEEWKDSKIGEHLINYIPYESGKDQLEPVIVNVIEKLSTFNWIKTNDGGWVSPQNAVVATPYLSKVFKKYPEYRLNAEKVLNKKFINFEWNISENKKVIDKYKINNISKEEFIKILELIGFPNELLENRKALFELYDTLLNIISKRPYSWGENNLIQEYKNGIKKSKVFPIESEGFAPLEIEGKSKTFWISSASKRDSGINSLEGQAFRIVNSQYTYKVNDSSQDASDETQSKNEQVKKENDILRQLLSKLDIMELREDNLLSQVQIPSMLENKNNESNIKMLLAIFESFRFKRTYEEAYIKELNKIKEVTFVSDTYKSIQLKNLIIPRFLRNCDEDYVYDVLNISPLYISKEVQDIILGKNNGKEKFREFLIYCGIMAKPTIEKKCTKYGNSYQFHSYNKELYNTFTTSVNNDYTSSRSIEIQQVELDNNTKELLNRNDCNSKMLSNMLYNLWKSNFSDWEYSKYANMYSNITLGYAKINYFRNSTRHVCVEDQLWGGCNKNEIPLITADGRVVSSGLAKKVVLDKNIELKYSLRICDIVLEETDIIKGYSKNFLESLHIKEIKLSDLVINWEEAGRNIEFKYVLLAAVELLEAGVSPEGLLIEDVESKELIPSSEYKLGSSINNESKYMIEEQYGEIGKKAGKLLGLLEESDITRYLGIFSEYFESEDKSLVVKKIYSLLRKWSEWDLDNKNVIKNDLNKAVEKFNDKKFPMLIINDDELSKKLNNTDIKIISIKAKILEKFEICIAAKELGLILPENNNIIVDNIENLTNTEQEEINKIVSKYIEDLDEVELSRLSMCLRAYGGIEGIATRVFKTTSIKSQIGDDEDVTIDVELPFLNIKDGHLYVKKSTTIVDIIAYMFSLNGFERLKNARRELEIANKEIKNEDAKKSSLKYKNYNEILEKEIEQSINSDNLVAREEVEQQLKSRGILNNCQDDDSEWNIGMSPEEEEELRNSATNSLKNSFTNGLNIAVKEEKKEIKKDSNKNKEIKIDKYRINSKEYLKSQYNGKCQVCGEKIKLINGDNYIEVFHIREEKNDGWWIDRKYNILGFCPNCHAKAKHGGRDFTNIKEYALELSEGNIFPEEIDEFKGDYYRIPVVLNGKDESIVFSKDHLNHFAAFFIDGE